MTEATVSPRAPARRWLQLVLGVLCRVMIANLLGGNFAAAILALFVFKPARERAQS